MEVEAGLRLEEAMERLGVEGEGARMRGRLEEVEAELATAREELRLKIQAMEEVARAREQADRQLEVVLAESRVAACLRGEVSLLQQDNRSLEDHLEASRQIRAELEGKLEESREVGEHLQSEVSQESAKAVFLHFTQEQLNCQVNSLEEIVRNLKVENHLLNKAVNKLVVCVNQEKDRVAEEVEKLEEVTAQYNAENADAEQEFSAVNAQVKELREEVAKTEAEAKEQEVTLRAQLGQAEVARQELVQELEKEQAARQEVVQELEKEQGARQEAIQELEKEQGARQELAAVNERLEAVNDELRGEMDVAENDRTVLKDSLKEVIVVFVLDFFYLSFPRPCLVQPLSSCLQVEEERTKMTLDLGEVSQQKMSLEQEVEHLKEAAEEARGQLKEARGDCTEAEMTQAALQGELSSCREELSAVEQQAALLRLEVSQTLTKP